MEISLGEAMKVTARNKPAEFRFTDALPVNASGKIRKRELRTLE